jgi:hypothetical protein
MMVPVVAKNAENRELNPKDSSVALSAKKMQKYLWNCDATIDLYRYNIYKTAMVFGSARPFVKHLTGTGTI